MDAEKAMQMSELCTILLGSTGVLGVLVGFFLISFKIGKVVQKIDFIEKKIDDGFKEFDKRFDKVDIKIDKLEDRIKRLEDNIPDINISITRLEVRLEERTLKTLDFIKKEEKRQCE